MREFTHSSRLAWARATVLMRGLTPEEAAPGAGVPEEDDGPVDVDSVDGTTKFVDVVVDEDEEIVVAIEEEDGVEPEALRGAGGRVSEGSSESRVLTSNWTTQMKRQRRPMTRTKLPSTMSWGPRVSLMAGNMAWKARMNVEAFSSALNLSLGSTTGSHTLLGSFFPDTISISAHSLIPSFRSCSTSFTGPTAGFFRSV